MYLFNSYNEKWELRKEIFAKAVWMLFCKVVEGPSLLMDWYHDEEVWEFIFLFTFPSFSTTLTERSKLITETDGLRQQNAELRMLLHQYINSKVNQELEIPPTRVLNLNV